MSQRFGKVKQTVIDFHSTILDVCSFFVVLSVPCVQVANVLEGGKHKEFGGNYNANGIASGVPELLMVFSGRVMWFKCEFLFLACHLLLVM